MSGVMTKRDNDCNLVFFNSLEYKIMEYRYGKYFSQAASAILSHRSDVPPLQGFHDDRDLPYRN